MGPGVTTQIFSSISFYISLYTTEASLPYNRLLWQFLDLSHTNQRWLYRDVFDGEIQMALFQMGLNKAARPDGFVPQFFQQYWSIVGPSVCTHIGNIFKTGRIRREENKTFICLIPKSNQS